MSAALPEFVISCHVAHCLECHREFSAERERDDETEYEIYERAMSKLREHECYKLAQLADKPIWVGGR